MRNNVMKILTSILFALIINVNALAQDRVNYESKVIQTSRLNLEYIDFGGEGPVVIQIQGGHNFFNDPPFHPGMAMARDRMARSLIKLSENHRVLATVRRGYGKSDSFEFGFDVATGSEDLISLMDALDIEKAFFIGRDIACQEIIYMAEHHPERITGMAFYGMKLITVGMDNPEVAELEKHEIYQMTDLGEKAWSMIGPRATYQPHMYTENIKINIPTLWVFAPNINISNRQLMTLGSLEEAANSEWMRPESKAYYTELEKDKDRQKYLWEYLEKNNPNPKIQEAMNRTFGEHLEFIDPRIVLKDADEKDFDEFFNYGIYEAIRTFIDKVEAQN
jgi:pimeloyl-ACP methyl ester carboxylesterase